MKDDPTRTAPPGELPWEQYDPKTDPDSDYGDWLYENYRDMED